ncbi:MAG: hypothetical protein LLP51_06820 [Halorhodospira halophila]|uniref:hypothetical protein n=1 Tax=Halorhodospira halophila TaxID=1053 RepID=UPI0026F30332|nr:hypothetical protein [Halorhodospira halophila]MCC3751091.1 hypothetical protein [Halorhodospira halophila]
MPTERSTTADPQPKAVRIEGRVCSGRGLASEHLAAARSDLSRWLGAEPVAGTLNLAARRPYLLNRATARVFDSDHKMVWPAWLDDEPVLVYRWPGCALHILELVSASHLRRRTGLCDGERAAIDLPAQHLLPVPVHAWALWAALWGLRETRYYRGRRGYPILAEGLGRRLSAGQ